jgi:uncharacterized membrane protein YqjE
VSASRGGLFDSLRRLLHTGLDIAQVRLELLGADLALEKLRLIDVLLRALLGLLLLAVGLVLLIGFVLLLLWDGYRLPALAVLTLLCVLGGGLLLHAARRRLRQGDAMFAATRGELERDRAALGASRGDDA